MPAILLINPNTSARSLRMMMDVAAPHLPAGFTLRGVSAVRGVEMIVDEADLLASASEVVRLGSADIRGVAAIIVAAFGDPGVETLRGRVSVPVVGIGEASIQEAASGGRRFGIATTTPALAGAIERLVGALGMSRWFAGVRVPDVDPLVLAMDASLQEEVLVRLATDCFDLDGAEAVVVGGGPLSEAARALRIRFGSGIIEPVPAAIRCVVHSVG
jgi:allantoin racemase